MTADKNPPYFPPEIVDVGCPGAIQEGTGSYKCGILEGRACNGKIQGKPNGKKYKCKTTGFDIELREPVAP